jgi:Flp pilus assembly pilin Flp
VASQHQPPQGPPAPRDDGRQGTVAVEYAVILGTLAVAIVAGFAVLSGKLTVVMEMLPL